jgi:hypothetical protein
MIRYKYFCERIGQEWGMPHGYKKDIFRFIPDAEYKGTQIYVSADILCMAHQAVISFVHVCPLVYELHP